MKLIYFDETEKIMKVPEEALALLHKTREQLLKEQEKENAALLVFSSQMGPNHIAMELVDTYLLDLVHQMSKQKWFKFTLKTNFKKAQDELHKSLEQSIKNSLSNKQYLRDLSDEVGSRSEFDIFKLKNTIYMDLTRMKYKEADLLAGMVTVFLMLGYINNRYEVILNNMKKIYPALYETWFYGASVSEPLRLWKLGLEEYLNKFKLPTKLNLGDTYLVKCGLMKLDTNFSPDKIIEISTYVEHTEDEEINKLLTEAYELLEIKFSSHE